MKIIISGPSGVGKTTIIQKLLGIDNRFSLSKNYTTRKQRNANDTEYNFVNENQFLELIKNDFFLEHEYIFGNYYGTPKHVINQNYIIFNIDVLGAQSLKKLINAVAIMIIPPNHTEIKNRLMNRDSIINNDRVLRIHKEMENISTFDFIIMNDQIDLAIERLLKIIEIHDHNIECKKHIESDLYIK